MNEKSQNSTIYEVNIGEDEDQLLKFEKHISEQEVSFFNPKMNISMIFFSNFTHLSLIVFSLSTYELISK